jgi:hypothetical protein
MSRHLLKRILIGLGYAALSVLVVVFTVALVAYGQGYVYDFKTGRIIKTGLVLIQSTPTGAQVTQNGKVLKKKTTYRGSFESGSYTFEVTKDGFHSWKKTLQVVASEVTLAHYVILIPKKPKVTLLDSRPQVVTQNISRDHRHLVYVTGGVDPGVYTLDPADPKPTRIYAPKPATATRPAETVTDAVWSDDASHVLVTAQAGPERLHYLMTASGDDARNLTDQFRFDFTGLKFSGTNWRQLYWISPDGLRRLDVEAQSVSGVLADKVSQIQVAGDRILYVQATSLGRSLWSIDGRGTKQELIQALPESPSYALAYASYRGQDQLAVVPSRTRVGTLYSDIFSANHVAKTIARDVDDALFSHDAHLLTFSSPTHLTTYDLERSDITGKLVTYEVSGQQNISSLSWYDNYHFLLNKGGRLVLMEYDGANAMDLGALAGSLPAHGSADGRSILALRPESAGMSFVQIVLKP